jgi:hypothetical protein
MAMQVNEAEEALAQLAAQVPPPKSPRKFAFTGIGEQIIASLMQAADDQVKAAEALRVEVTELAENIGEALEQQAKRLAAMDARTKAFGQDVLDAHRKFINGGEHENPSP